MGEFVVFAEALIIAAIVTSATPAAFKTASASGDVSKWETDASIFRNDRGRGQLGSRHLNDVGIREHILALTDQRDGPRQR
jgi:hypothetical protein